MESYNYIEEALDDNLMLDKYLYEYLQEELDFEFDFMFSSLKDNIIREADENVSGENTEEKFWDKFIEIITNLLNKFRVKVDELIGKNKKFIEDELPKIEKKENWEGLSVNNIKPYWINSNEEDESAKNIIRNNLIPLLRANKPNPEEVSGLIDQSSVENYKGFKELKIDELSFAQSAKIKFLYGKDAKKEPESVNLSNEEFKNVCINSMIPFVRNYNIKSIVDETTVLKQEVNNIKKEIKNKALGESFSLLENQLFKDTDLYYCINYEKLFEAEGETTQQNSTSNNNKDQPKNQVVDNGEDKNGENSKSSTNYKKYYKIACKLINIAIAANMTSKETIYLTYMQVLKGIANPKKPKEEKKEETENTEEKETKKEETTDNEKKK